MISAHIPVKVAEGSMVWILVIEHRYGFNHYASLTEEGMTDILYGYVEEWWEESTSEDEIPSNKNEAIDLYFETVEDEWYTYDHVKLGS